MAEGTVLEREPEVGGDLMEPKRLDGPVGGLPVAALPLLLSLPPMPVPAVLGAEVDVVPPAC